MTACIIAVGTGCFIVGMFVGAFLGVIGVLGRIQRDLLR